MKCQSKYQSKEITSVKTDILPNAIKPQTISSTLLKLLKRLYVGYYSSADVPKFYYSLFLTGAQQV